MTATKKVAVVGDRTSVSGFGPLGFSVYALSAPADARALWPELTGGAFGVVFVTEPVYEAIADLVATIADQPVPAVTVIPGAGSAGGVGGRKLERAVERALGTTALIREEDE
ncbi:MAG TPA: V-type ATP synthase subunit F [Coriobacteriia bacterium]|nr:V-type ATP synthase subunit F [Coriobacteriia bacterium]